MSKRKYDHYVVETNNWGGVTSPNWPTILAHYDYFRSLNNALVSLYGVTKDGQFHKIRTNIKTKTLYIFYGSLSVIKILEDEGIDKKVKPGTVQNKAFEIAQDSIKEHFKSIGTSWEYDLDLETEDFLGTDVKKLYMHAEHSIDTFEHNHHFEEDDGAYDAQGYTAFTL